ncbi:hypothetical protein MRB53_034628 [Persea americana]|uniref:Uncharacterized protein n=1 Tax=Persea americana TaxID=3435 RepID=A0ACC2K299_PERAE|nr:hypothetical protein MRB53_034628 [Persea americana]
MESLSEIIKRTQWLEDHMDEFLDFSDWSENTFDEEEDAERLTSICNTGVLRRVGLPTTREELAERGLPWTFLIEPSLPENFENTPWDEEGTSYVPPPYAHLDGDPNNPIIICIISHLKKNDNTNSVVIEDIEQESKCLTIDHWDGSFIQIMMVDFVADQDEMERDENQIDSQSKVASCHMIHSIEEEHDEIKDKDTPKEEAVEQTSNEAYPIQLCSGKQLPERTTEVEKKSKGKAVEENESTSVQSQQGAKKVVNEKSPTKYDVLAHLKNIQAPLSVYDVLRLSQHIRKALIKAFLDPDEFLNEVHQTEIELESAFSPNICAACLATISFMDEDILLGTKAHNRPLFVKGILAKVKMNRIMLDCGSTVNLIPLKKLLSLGKTVYDLESSNLVITGFNQSSQQALGTIMLKLTVGDLTTKGVFHVIDALTSYNVLLGRPWLHENGIIPSTLHQCFKYFCKGIQKKVIADENPFTKAESYFADAKFYIGCETINKIEEDPQTKSSKKDDSKRRPTFQYIPKSQRKSGASLLCPV